MVKEIVKDQLFLSQKSIEANINDKQVIIDLIDTLKANSPRCIGMAANMIGVRKRIIIVSVGMFPLIMVNPIIARKTSSYQTKEGCLSLEGERTCTRYKEIEVNYLDQNFNSQHGKYTGLIAEIIQHEVDHLDGIII